MGLILSIDSATDMGSVALHRNEELLNQVVIEEPRSHSSRLAPAIQELLSSSGNDPEDLAAVAVSEGPGSYTGLRIGGGLAKGLCYSLGIPLIPVSTLKAVAWGVREQENGKVKKHYVPMIDARRMEVYATVLDEELRELKAVEPVILQSDSFGAQLQSGKVIFCGSGAEKFREICAHDNAEFRYPAHPMAAYIGRLAWSLYQQGKYADLNSWEPFYLKAFQAGKPKTK